MINPGLRALVSSMQTFALFTIGAVIGGIAAGLIEKYIDGKSVNIGKTEEQEVLK